MPLDQTGPPPPPPPPPPTSGSRQSNLNAWLTQPNQQGGRGGGASGRRPPESPAVHSILKPPRNVPASFPLTARMAVGYGGSQANSLPNGRNGNKRSNGSNDSNVEQTSAPRKRPNGQNITHRSGSPIISSVSRANIPTNGVGAGTGSPSISNARNNTHRRLLGRPPGRGANNAQQRFRQFSTPTSSAMDIDELANTEDGDGTGLLPFLMPDRKPRPGQNTGSAPKMKRPLALVAPKLPNPSLRPTHSPPTTTTNGTSQTASPAAMPIQRKPAISTHVVDTPISRPHLPVTPNRTAIHSALAPVTIPPTSPPGSSKVAQPSGLAQLPQLTQSPRPTALTKSPGAVVGRRSKMNNLPRVQTQSNGERPKGWKPDTSYNEATLHSLDVGASDPTLPAKLIVSPHGQKTGTGSRDQTRIHDSNDANNNTDSGGPRDRPRRVQSAHVLFSKPVDRPPRQTIESVRRKIFLNSTVCFEPFVCEWAGCRAELQNMATLRKHVAIVHGRPLSTDAATQTCQWRRCADRVPPIQFRDEGDDADAAGDEKRHTLLEHLEYYHLEPLAWHRGDGFVNNSHLGPLQPPASVALLPKAKQKASGGAKDATSAHAVLPDKDAAAQPEAPPTLATTTATADMALDNIPPEDLPRYLLDDQGRQVTPLLRDPLLAASSAFWTEAVRERRFKKLHRQQQQQQQQQRNKRPDRSRNSII